MSEKLMVMLSHIEGYFSFKNIIELYKFLNLILLMIFL